MSLEFNYTTDQYVKFGDILGGETTKTFLYWIYNDNVEQTETQFHMGKTSTISGTTYGWVMTMFGPTWGSYWEHKIVFEQRFTTNRGQWKGNTELTNNTWYHIAISYDRSSTSNDPIIYVNGSAETVTETDTPSGTVREDDTDFCIGVPTEDEGVGPFYSMDGKIDGILIYDSILSASTILSAYNAGRTSSHTWAQNNSSGLIFAPSLYCAVNYTPTSYIGATLGATDYIKESIGCTTGTPGGSPKGA